MKQLWSTLLTFLFAHSSLARWMIHVFTWLQLFEDILANPDEMLLCRSPEGRRRIEAYIARLEDWIAFLTNARAAELAGISRTYIEDGRGDLWAPHTPRDWDSLMQRYQRMRLAFRNIERMARRRAARLKRERAACPLRLRTACASTSPALRAEEESRRRLFDVQISSSSALHWGRWIARACAQDGGGSHARGPPPPFPKIRHTNLGSPASGNAPMRP